MISITKGTIGFDSSLFSIEETNFDCGKVHVLMGRNGIGKSAFLHTLSGLIQTQGGTFDCDGKTLDQYSSRELSKKMAYVSSSPSGVPFLTVDAFLMLGRYRFTNVFGQATAYYAKPNSGKTLLTICLLIEAMKKGEIKADDVFYINADDNYKGLVTKLEIAEKYGFNMLAPSFNGFEASKFMDYLSQLILTDDAKGKVLILDTLKKFTNIMDKKVASDFGVYMRSFVSKGGTIIMLAHTNKHRDDEGKVVFSGTSDIVDDVDCAYTIDVSENGNQETKTIIFEKKL